MFAQGAQKGVFFDADQAIMATEIFPIVVKGRFDAKEPVPTPACGFLINEVTIDFPLGVGRFGA